MATRQQGTLQMGSNFEGNFDAPLDARTKVMLKADLTAEGNFPYSYIGLTVFVEEELKKYTLIGEDPTDINNWRKDEASGTGGSELENSLEAKVAVGGIPVGKTWAAGDSLEDVLRDMLYPLMYPTLSDPSVSLSTSSPKIYEKGATPKVNLTATANLGSISPDYGTNGKRAGAPTEYALVGIDGSENATGTWADVDVSEANASFSATAKFSAGPQPKDSHGKDYDVPYPDGTVKTSSPLTFTFVYCMYSNTSNIEVMAKHNPEAMSVKEKVLNFPAQTVANPECFSVPAAWTVQKVEVLNDLSGKYEDCAREFTVTDETRQDAAGADVAYKKYTDNRGYKAAARTIKVTIA